MLLPTLTGLLRRNAKAPSISSDLVYRFKPEFRINGNLPPSGHFKERLTLNCSHIQADRTFKRDAEVSGNVYYFCP